ncbi:MAG: glucuronate isomerase [Planctomycetia bacterium]|nr:glucuronate isomerase [Planctomycetia bacterium]
MSEPTLHDRSTSASLCARLFDALDAMWLVDPHSHINPLAPASTTLDDILGYNYYTELAHAAGLPREAIADPALSPKQRVGLLVESLGQIDNTIQVHWLIELSQRFFGFADTQLRPDNWDALYDRSAAQMANPGWAAHVLKTSKLEAVFLTNDFDDTLTGFDTKLYIPCLRTDELVFHLGRGHVRDRLVNATGTTLGDAASLRVALGQLFEHFVQHGARACAISLPPSFSPRKVSLAAADEALTKVFLQAGKAPAEQRDTLSCYVFWTLAELCAEYHLPFDLMIGVNRAVYPGGVHQGQDLFDSRVSLIQYADLFNSFPQVMFPVSVLASVTNQELASYAWIFPNVIAHGHWWYSNIPSLIEHDAANRLEAVPANKQIGYYSDMYKLEFALPKFAMYKRVLARILAERFVIGRGWNEERAVALGHQVLRGNVDRVFGLT